MHVLTEHPLPGLDLRRLKRLTDAGLQSLEDIVAIGPEALAERTGFDVKTCRTLVSVATSAMANSKGSARGSTGVIELTPARDEPASVRLTRGLSAARTVEHAVSLVRKARTHAGRRPRKDSWTEAHAKARRQLRKLLERLQQLQHAVLSEGLSEQSHDHLTRELEALERSLEPILDTPIRKKVLRRLRQTARETRRALTNG